MPGGSCVVLWRRQGVVLELVFVPRCYGVSSGKVLIVAGGDDECLVGVVCSLVLGWRQGVVLMLGGASLVLAR